jgi:hypothetical protein
MSTFSVEDSFGRSTNFKGSLLADETTDNDNERKPQWSDVEVWVTEAGNFVVRRTSNYRIRHNHVGCTRAEGFTLIEADESDTYLCPTCGADGNSLHAQEARVSVQHYLDLKSFVESFQQDGRYSQFARTVLSNISDQNDAVNNFWNTVHVE